MKLTKLFLIASLAVLAGAVGCEQGSPIGVDDNVLALESDLAMAVFANGSATHVVDLIANRSHDVGDVAFDDVDLDSDGTADALQVVYTTAQGWKLASIDLWVGPSLSDMPDTRMGDPKPRKFPYRAKRIGDTVWAVTIPFEQIGYQCGNTDTWYAAAHAVVKKVEGRWRHRVESAWSGDTRFRDKRGHWATYTSIVISCDETEEPPNDVCETAFAYGPMNTCLAEILDMDQFVFPFEGAGWGYALGPLQPGTYQYDILARAGSGDACDAGSGIKVGTVTVEYVDGTATVSYTADPTYGFNEAYLHVGALPYPEGITNYPIQPENFEFTATGLNKAATWTQTKTGLTGEIYVIARSTVCGPF